jgi:hypothetical protein
MILRRLPPRRVSSGSYWAANNQCVYGKSQTTKNPEAGVKAWNTWREKNMTESIQLNGANLKFVLSKHSIQSEWVMTENRKARESEKKENRRKLFPILLSDFEILRNWTCFDADSGKDLAVEVREYYIRGFSNWKDDKAFESAFVRLKKDLQAENSKKS